MIYKNSLVSGYRLLIAVSLVVLIAACSGGDSADEIPTDTGSDTSVILSVAIGETSSTVKVTNSINGSYKLYTSSDENCDIANYETCANGELNSLSAGTTVTLNNLTQATTKDHYFVLVNADNDSVKKTISLQKFSGRFGHRIAVVDSTMYLIGGGQNYDSAENDVWSSTDGANWTQVTAAANFPARSGHQVAVVGNTMYVIAGSTGDFSLNDVWSSTDGKVWTEEKADDPATGFSARYSHQVAVLDDTMYVIGGWASGYLNDVWSSTDGANWKQVTAAASFSARYGHQVAVVGNTMYVIGGDDGSKKNDIWSSTDGANWKQVTTNSLTIFSARRGHQVAVLDGTMYVIGGDDGSKKNDVWSSSDNGVTWTLVTTGSTVFSARSDHQVAVIGNTMYVIGGTDGGNQNDVWSSTDGATWRQAPYVLSFDYPTK